MALLVFFPPSFLKCPQQRSASCFGVDCSRSASWQIGLRRFLLGSQGRFRHNRFPQEHLKHNKWLFYEIFHFTTEHTLFSFKEQHFWFVVTVKGKKNPSMNMSPWLSRDRSELQPDLSRMLWTKGGSVPTTTTPSMHLASTSMWLQ